MNTPERQADGNAPADTQHGDWPHFPSGPALLYVHSDQGTMIGEPDARAVTRVDLGGLPTGGGVISNSEARRERRLLRALLEHTLHALEQAGE